MYKIRKFAVAHIELHTPSRVLAGNLLRINRIYAIINMIHD